MYRPWDSHCLLLPMVSSLYFLYVCSVIVTFVCIKKVRNCKISICIKQKALNCVHSSVNLYDFCLEQIVTCDFGLLGHFS